MTDTRFNFDKALDAELAKGGTQEEIGARMGEIVRRVTREEIEAGRADGDEAAMHLLVRCQCREGFLMLTLGRIMRDLSDYMDSNDGMPEHSLSDRLFLARWFAMATKLMRASVDHFDENGRRRFHG